MRVCVKNGGVFVGFFGKKMKKKAAACGGGFLKKIYLY